VAKIEGVGREVLDKAEWIAIATTGADGPHLVATWGDYVRKTGVGGNDDELVIPAGRFHKTEENLRHDDRVEVLFATRQVQGSHGAGQGCCISGRGSIQTSGPAMDAVKAHFPWARAALVIKASKTQTQL
jgi:hypothetical protein